MAEKIMILLGLLSLGYFVGIVAYAGWSSKFPFFWAGLGACFLAAAWVLHRHLQTPMGLKIAGVVCVGGGLALFLFVEGLIVGAMLQKPEPGLDYIVVLGAQVKGNRPSLALSHRIWEAAEYLKGNPKTRAILSGGKGTGEDISEAQCMRQELEKLGISEERLIEENKSTSTQENIAYSYALLQADSRKETEQKEIKIGIVTNNFHIYRGTAIAKKKMNCQIQGIPAKSNTFLQMNYLVREFFGVVKDKLAGNL